MDNGLPVSLLQEDDLPDVYEELHGTEEKWKSIGIHLKLPISCLEEIGKEHKGNTQECSLQMQIAWLRSKTATWKSLVGALRKSSVGYDEKARDIEKKKLSSNNTERRKDSQSQSQPSPNVFLIEHLEWLLKIGCSVDKIMEWAREKQQNQAVETPSCFSSYNGIDADIPYGSTIPDSGLTDLAHGTFNPQQASGSNSDNTSVTKQRKRKQSDKNQQPRPKKSRKKDTSPVQFVLINTLQGTDRERQLQLKKNMLQIIKKLKRDRDAAEFVNFVDEGRAEGYYKIIGYPMCLQEIEDRIKRHQCDSREVFCEEFDAIVENCVRYNGPDTPITEKVQRLKIQFDELVRIYLTIDTGGASLCELPLTAEEEGDSEHLNFEQPSNDEEYNMADELESMLSSIDDSQHDMGADDLFESSQEIESSDDHKKSDRAATTVAKDAKARESSVKVQLAIQGTCDHDQLQETAGRSTVMNNDEDSDSELPSIKWK